MKTKNFLYNNEYILSRRKELRRDMTSAERILWEKVRNNQLGYKIKRQYSAGPFILDFYCPSKRLAIEIDGGVHNNTYEYDKERTQFLNHCNIRVIRFTNDEVEKNIEDVMMRLLKALAAPLLV
jgi:very-short-patch-repair endonuclease